MRRRRLSVGLAGVAFVAWLASWALWAPSATDAAADQPPVVIGNTLTGTYSSSTGQPILYGGYRLPTNLAPHVTALVVLGWWHPDARDRAGRVARMHGAGCDERHGHHHLQPAPLPSVQLLLVHRQRILELHRQRVGLCVRSRHQRGRDRCSGAADGGHPTPDAGHSPARAHHTAHRLVADHQPRRRLPRLALVGPHRRGLPAGASRPDPLAAAARRETPVHRRGDGATTTGPRRCDACAGHGGRAGGTPPCRGPGTGDRRSGPGAGRCRPRPGGAQRRQRRLGPLGIHGRATSGGRGRAAAGAAASAASARPTDGGRGCPGDARRGACPRRGGAHGRCRRARGMRHRRAFVPRHDRATRRPADGGAPRRLHPVPARRGRAAAPGPRGGAPCLDGYRQRHGEVHPGGGHARIERDGPGPQRARRCRDMGRKGPTWQRGRSSRGAAARSPRRDTGWPRRQPAATRPTPKWMP